MPSRISVEGRPDSVTGLVAYTNTEESLVGPKGMNCAGAIGADGTAFILVWPKGSTDGHPEEVVAATCTLPASDHQLCITSLNDVATRC